MRNRAIVLGHGLAIVAVVTGCVGTRTGAEKTARERVEQVGSELRPSGARPALPQLRADASLGDFVRYAVLNHPSVEAEYHEWRAVVQEITRARSLPDPQLTFEADLTDTLMTFMPGVMFDIMAPGKRAAMAREMAAQSEVTYRNYVATVLRTGTTVRKAWTELAYVDEAARLRESSLNAIEQSLALSAADYSTGTGMSNLDAQIRSLNAAGLVRTELAALRDRRVAVRARFKSILGLKTTEADPAWPATSLAPSVLLSEDELWSRARAANPEIASMQAMVDMAVSSIEVARKTRTPDFALGAMADLKASPLMVRPTASVTLPIWRDKITATIAAAEARRDAAVARLAAEQLNVAAELAQMIYMVRESDRMIGYIDATALPNIDRILVSAEAGYQAGMGRASEIPATRLMALDMQLERLDALRQREDAITDLSLMIADVSAGGLPVVAETSSH